MNRFQSIIVGLVIFVSILGIVSIFSNPLTLLGIVGPQKGYWAECDCLCTFPDGKVTQFNNISEAITGVVCPATAAACIATYAIRCVAICNQYENNFGLARRPNCLPVGGAAKCPCADECRTAWFNDPNCP